MAIDPNYICQPAINEIQAELRIRGEVHLDLPQLLFIFGLEDKDEDGINQQNLQDCADWFDAQTWVYRLVVGWYRRTVSIYERWA